MNELNNTIQELRHFSPAKLAGALKTHPYAELLHLQEVLQQALIHPGLMPRQTRDVRLATETLQKGIAKRLEAAQQLIAKFAYLTPEIIALTNSVFVLASSRDLLDDIKSAYATTAERSDTISRASANILEAVNIEIQQRFYKLTPETIAIHYSGQELEAYRQLLKRFVSQLPQHSPIFQVYKVISRKLLEGIRLYRTQIKTARDFCQKIFQGNPPDYDRALGQYTIEELETYANNLRAVSDILSRDITGRPSIIEFSIQGRTLIGAIPLHLAHRKIQMRKASRVLQISHYINFIEAERIPENAAASLMFCQMLFDETKQFLLTQQRHLDVALNIKSLEEAVQRIDEGLRYRQYALGQLFKEISSLSADDLAFVPERQLGDNNLLLQEVQNLIDDFLRTIPASEHSQIQEIADALRGNLHKIHQAILTSKHSPDTPKYQIMESARSLPTLSKFYDEELLRLIQKALKPGEASQDTAIDQLNGRSFVIPQERLRRYIDTFLEIVR